MVVGSGAGGGVIAAALAEAGQRVIVLEAGGLSDEADFNQLRALGLPEPLLARRARTRPPT